MSPDEIDAYNKNALDKLKEAGQGMAEYLQSDDLVILDPDWQMLRFFWNIHRGSNRRSRMFHLYDNRTNKKLIVAVHVADGRLQFEAAIHRLKGYENWKIDYLA